MSSLKPCLHKGSLIKTAQWIKYSSRSIHSINSEEDPTHRKAKSSHEYTKLWKFTTVESTSKYLLDNIFYHKDGVVALNKPASLGSSKAEDSIYHCLPYLAKEFGYKYLQLVSVPDKLYSGVTILASDGKITEKLKQSIRRSKSIYARDPKQTFLAITVGHPTSEENVDRYGVTKVRKDKSNYPSILREWGMNELKRREVNVGFVRHRVLAKSELAALVSVSAWQLRHHCPRMYLSDVMLSPVLGDNMFGPRVGSLFEKPVLIKPWFAPAVKALPPSLLQTLKVRSGSESLIPLHFHLHELVLHGFLRGGSDLILKTEPPNFFQWTQKKLNLEVVDDSEDHHNAGNADTFSEPQESRRDN